MSTSKGRKIVKDQSGKGIFVDTVPKKSAVQGILVTQDAEIAQINAMQAALAAFAAACTSAAAVSDIVAAGTALTAALNAITQASVVNLK